MIVYMMKLLLTALLITGSAAQANTTKISQERRVRIGVIDTGIDLAKYPYLLRYMCRGNMHKDLTGNGIKDVHGHGSNIAALIASKINPDKSCLVIIKYWHDGEAQKTPVNEAAISAVEVALAAGVRYLNMSSDGMSYFPKERLLLNKFVRAGGKLVVAAGNGQTLIDKSGTRRVPINLGAECTVYPACYKLDRPFAIVGGLGLTSSNYGGPVNQYRPAISQSAFGTGSMSGTSQAAANYTGDLVRKDYP